jgi:hypothetical protein
VLTAGNIGGSVRHQKGDEFGDFFWATGTTERNPSQ